jgi:hypothetical protein
MQGGTVIQPIAMEVCIFIKITAFIIHASFGGRMIGGLISAKSCILVFSMGNRHGSNNSALLHHASM